MESILITNQQLFKSQHDKTYLTSSWCESKMEEEDKTRPISIKLPDAMLAAIDECVRRRLFKSRSEFFRKAIEELLKTDLESTRWDKFTESNELTTFD